MNSRTRVDWRNLPSDLLFMIADRSEIRRLRAVCSSWRSSLPLPSTTSPLYSVRIPLPIEPTGAATCPNHGMYHSLSERIVYCIEPLVNDDDSESPKLWIVKTETTSTGKMRFLNSLTNDFGFPDSRDELPPVLDMLNFRVLLVGIEYDLSYVKAEIDAGGVSGDGGGDSDGDGDGCCEGGGDGDDNGDAGDGDEGGDDEEEDDVDDYYDYDEDVPVKINKVWKVVMSDDHRSILCSFSTKGKLAHYKLGDKKWTVVYNANDRRQYQSDIVFHKQKFYAIYNSQGKIVVVDNDSSLKVEVFESPVCADGRYSISDEWFNYFVKANGDLFLLRKYYYYYDDDMNTMILFKVYRLKEIENEWVEVTSIGDQAFFASDDCSFAVSVEQVLGCKGNCIYCTDITFMENELDGEPGCDVGIFELESSTSKPLRHYEKYCETFWPIPEWLSLEEWLNLDEWFNLEE